MAAQIDNLKNHIHFYFFFLISITVPAKLKMSPLLQEGMTQQRGDKIRVRIPISGCPAPTITWIKDGEVMEMNERIEITVSDNCANLLIHDSEKGDAGKYELRVENEFGSDSCAFYVTLTGKYPTLFV